MSEIQRLLTAKGPPDIAVYECSCRNIREHPCQPTEVCLIVGRPFVDFILEHHPTTSRRISQQEAVELVASFHVDLEPAKPLKRYILGRVAWVGKEF